MELKITNRYPSTDTEIRLLEKHFPVDSLVQGKQLEHDEIEGVINLKRDQNRYRSVLNRWRTLIQSQHNIVLKAVPSVGFRVLSDTEKLGKATSQFEGVVRGISRTGNTLRAVETKALDTVGKKSFEHQNKRLAALTATISQKRFAAPLPVLEDSSTKKKV